MAHMYPESSSRIKYSGEKKLFERFKVFSDDFYIIHSLPWLSQQVSNEIKRFTPEGEIDFVILHKKFGILCVEVKGGRVSYNKHAYFSNGKPIKNPYEQARDNNHYLRKQISSEVENVLFGYCVAFPDVKSPPFSDEDKEITFDIDDIKDLENKILGIYKYWAKIMPKKHLSDEDIVLIMDMLVPESKEILNDKIEYDNCHWLTLSEKQTNILEAALKVKKYFVSGRAGTGKTILAIILARILLLKKRKILFLTFNNILNKKINQEIFPNEENIDILTFHGFLIKYKTRTDIKEVINNEREVLQDILNNIENKYDALIIDEAQSFGLVWLNLLSKYFDNKSIYIFTDELQSFGHEGKVSNQVMKKIFKFDGEKYLSLNYRSPRKVHERLLEMFDSSIEQISPRDSDDLDLREIITNDANQAIKETIDNLLNNNIQKENIALLISSKRKDDAYIYKYKDIEVETVQRYRGMEKSIIIYIMTSATENDLNEFYVAYSRATTQTIVIIPEYVLSLGKSYFAQMLIKSDITEVSLKNTIKRSSKDYYNELIENKKVFSVYGDKGYYNRHHFLLMDSGHEFIKTLLVDYLLKFDISVVQLVTKTPRYATFYSNILDNVHLLEYDYCEQCYKKSFVRDNFCVNCSSDILDKDIIEMIEDDIDILNNSKSKVEGNSLHDSLRSIGRYYRSGLDRVVTDKIIAILNKQTNVTYISGVIEILMILYKRNDDLISLGDIRDSQQVCKLNNLHEMWNQKSALCTNIFLEMSYSLKPKKKGYTHLSEVIYLIKERA